MKHELSPRSQVDAPDIVGELGLDNVYTQTASLAMELSLKYNNFELRRMATELARLYKSISYDDDKFSHVQAMQRDVREAIRKFEKEISAWISIDEMKEGRSADQWKYEFIKNGDSSFLIRCFVQRADEAKPYTAAQKEIKDLLDRSVDLATLKKQEWTSRGTGENGTDDERIDYEQYYNKDDVLIASTEIYHHTEGHTGVGITEIYYFNDLLTTYELWNQITKLLRDNRGVEIED